jgi:hypothetical protein
MAKISAEGNESMTTSKTQMDWAKESDGTFTVYLTTLVPSDKWNWEVTGCKTISGVADKVSILTIAKEHGVKL